MIPKLLIVFALNRNNKNSFAALAGALSGNLPTSEHLVLPVSEEKIEEELENLSCAASNVLICFSFTTFDLLEIAQLIGKIKEKIASGRLENIVLLAGGSHSTGAPAESLKIGFDYVIAGEGEISFPFFVQAIASHLDPLSIQGVVAWRGGKIVHSGLSEKACLDLFSPFSPQVPLFSPIEITRGCRQGCHFCQTTFLFGSHPRHRGIEKIEEVVRHFVQAGRKDIRFVCPDALSYGCSKDGKQDLSAVESLLRRASLAGAKRLYLGSFPSEIWPGSVTPQGLEIVRRYCSNNNIVMGVQSGSPAVLERIHRRHTIEEALASIRLISDFGFTAKVDFIFGFPGETEREQQETAEFMLRIADQGAVIHSHSFMPLAGTPLSNAPPPQITPHLVKILQRLEGSGKQFGTWEKQHEVAHRIYEFRRQIAFDMGKSR